MMDGCSKDDCFRGRLQRNLDLTPNNMSAPMDQQSEKENLHTQAINPSISNLPDEILEYILSQLTPYRDLVQCKLVCKRWHYIILGKIRNYLFQNSFLI